MRVVGISGTPVLITERTEEARWANAGGRTGREGENQGGEDRQERDASTEAVEEEEQTGGPHAEGDG